MGIRVLLADDHGIVRKGLRFLDSDRDKAATVGSSAAPGEVPSVSVR